MWMKDAANEKRWLEEGSQGEPSENAPERDAWPGVLGDIGLADIAIHQRVPVALNALRKHEAPEDYRRTPLLATHVYVHDDRFPLSIPQCEHARYGVMTNSSCKQREQHSTTAISMVGR